MKKSNRLLIKIGLMFICLFFLIILCNNKTFATSKPILSLDSPIKTGEELWNIIPNKTYKPYCVDPSTKFTGGTYTVKEKWTFEKGKVTKNGEEVKDIKTILPELERAYILAVEDKGDYEDYEEKNKTNLEKAFDLYKKEVVKDENGNTVYKTPDSIKNGIYNVLSYKQEAIWMLQLANNEKKWYWKNWDGDEKYGGNGSLLIYYWWLRSK